MDSETRSVCDDDEEQKSNTPELSPMESIKDDGNIWEANFCRLELICGTLNRVTFPLGPKGQFPRYARPSCLEIVLSRRLALNLTLSLGQT